MTEQAADDQLVAGRAPEAVQQNLIKLKMQLDNTRATLHAQQQLTASLLARVDTHSTQLAGLLGTKAAEAPAKSSMINDAFKVLGE